MSIDIGRLAIDRTYWDSVAPEGAEAFIDGVFTMWLGSIEFSFDDGKWVKECISWPLSKYVMAENFTVIIRPDAPEEWDGTGLPPVGTECEANDVGHGWISATVIAHDEDEGVAVCKTDYGYDGYGELRPLRTPEQRERQSVIEQAFSKLSEFHDADQVLGDLYDAGMLHKQED